MEISLLSAKGLPNNCLLSVRAGSTRRQAPADSKFNLKFPKVLRKGDTFKVDVFQRIGEARLLRSAATSEPGVNAYPVALQLDGVGAASITLQVDQRSASKKLEADAQKPQVQAEDSQQDAKQEIQSEDSARPDSARSASRRHLAAMEAEHYLDEHNLLSWTQLLFEDLLRERPADPWFFIHQQMQGIVGENCKKDCEPQGLPCTRTEESKIEDVDVLAARLEQELKELEDHSISDANLSLRPSLKEPEDRWKHASICEESMLVQATMSMDVLSSKLQEQLKALESRTHREIQESMKDRQAVKRFKSCEGDMSGGYPSKLDILPPVMPSVKPAPPQIERRLFST